MVRKKLAVAIAAIGVLQTNMANALGVGDFSLFSALNQPLEAEIRLLNTEDLDNSQVIIKLAGPEDFSNAGISRDFFLTNIDFSVELDGQGNGVIKVTTKEPVIEPYLNFLIETRWPNGRLLREYTVLLDLPVFSESTAKPVAAAASSSAAPAQAELPPAAATAASVPVVTNSKPTSSARKNLQEGELSPGEKYRVRSDDTLWEIALKSRPGSGVSVQQTMVGIQRLNPQAFINGNINRLKAGSVLRLPTENDISVSDKQAVGEVANQNRSWRTGDDTAMPTADAQLDASSTGSSDNTYTEQPRLSIATSGESDNSAAGEGEGSGGAGSVALQSELAASEENLDKVQRDNEELQSRLDDMEARMATLQRLLELKEGQLADLQDSAGAQAGAAEESENAVAEEAVVEEPVAAKPEVKEEPKAEPKPKPAPKAEPSLLENPLVAGGAGALLLAAIAIVLLRRRKAQQEAEEEFTIDYTEEETDSLADVALDEEIVEEVVETPEVDETDDLVAELEQQIAADNAEEAARAAADETEAPLIEGVEPLEAAAPVVADPAPAVATETGDAIAEADIYVAYGRYQQAIDLLRSALEQEPERSDLHVKLLEVYIETRDKPGFQQQYLALQSLGNDAATGEVKEMLSSVEGVADWLSDLPGNTNNFTDEDMDADLIEGLHAAADGEAEPVDDIDLAGDDLEIDLDLGDIDGEISLDATQESDEMSLDDLELGDDALDLSEELELDEDAGLDLELDLDLDDDNSDEFSEGKTVQFDAADLQAELAKTQAASEEESLELDESFDLPEESDPSESDGFDLDLDDDLDLESLGDADLSDLEAEFGDSPELSPELPEESSADEVDLADEVDDLAFDLGEDDATDTLELDSIDPDATVEYSLDDVEQELAAGDTEGSPAEDSSAEESESFDSAVAAEASDDDFDFLADTDEVATKLDLARAYIDMGDTEGARDILDEVLQEGSDEQKQEAQSLAERID
ncbi:FimV/HubP family polar landmark protein [Oceanicoccus sagamiensis]|uniref:LysM domain-containing protein n=1 Tax=Oceanicoccus sagamiensis TaxID=716816 RepID=A0A1X9NFH5_9GAMM|nr:FimV/HubP family polar landmark protein [Oceanicoccus sagamiensis]ARN75931.1 hypothetical protein BST96_18615 [Oceanicoccus sagamiensis]